MDVFRSRPSTKVPSNKTAYSVPYLSTRFPYCKRYTLAYVTTGSAASHEPEELGR